MSWSLLGEQEYTLRRYPKATRDPEGRPYKGIPEEIKIVASIQPATGRILELLPEGERANVTKVAYTTTPLIIADEYTGTQADEILYGDEVFQVVEVQKWEDVDAIYQALLRRHEYPG